MSSVFIPIWINTCYPLLLEGWHVIWCTLYELMIFQIKLVNECKWYFMLKCDMMNRWWTDDEQMSMVHESIPALAQGFGAQSIALGVSADLPNCHGLGHTRQLEAGISWISPDTSRSMHLYAFVCICMHLYAFVCICMHLFDPFRIRPMHNFKGFKRCQHISANWAKDS